MSLVERLDDLHKRLPAEQFYSPLGEEIRNAIAVVKLAEEMPEQITVEATDSKGLKYSIVLWPHDLQEWFGKLREAVK